MTDSLKYFPDPSNLDPNEYETEYTPNYLMDLVKKLLRQDAIRATRDEKNHPDLLYVTQDAAVKLLKKQIKAEPATKEQKQLLPKQSPYRFCLDVTTLCSLNSCADERRIRKLLKDVPGLDTPPNQALGR